MRIVSSATLAIAGSLMIPCGFCSGTGAGEEVRGGAEPGPHLEGVELDDQFGDAHSWTFPAFKPMVLLAADKKGYQGLGPWIDSIRARSQDCVTVVGVADMRGVPGFLRGKVRRKFQSAEKYPVLLDWEGAVLTPLDPLKGVPNAYLISPGGRVILHLSGEATDAKLKQLQLWIDARGAVGGNGAGTGELAKSAT